MYRTSLHSKDLLLPDKYLSLHTHDFEEAREVFSRTWDSRPVEPMSENKITEISLYSTLLNNVSIGLVAYRGADVKAMMAESTGIYVLMPLRGYIDINADETRIRCYPGNSIVLNKGVKFEKTMCDDCKQLVFMFEPDAVSRNLLRQGVSTAEAPLCFESYPDSLQGYSSPWLRTVQYVLGELQHARGECVQAPMQELLEELLIANLLSSQRHNYSLEINSLDRSNSEPWYIKKVEEYLQTSAEQTITLTKLAKDLGVCQRTIQKGFKEHRGISPTQYLKEIRLQRVRRALLQGNPRENVTSLAMGAGFRQLGWFSKQYRNKFGEFPSETRRLAIENRHSTCE